MEDTKAVIIEKREHVARLVLSRPAKMNSMGEVFFRDLEEAVAQVSGDDEVRAILLEAEGKVFCAGFDLQEIGTMLAGNDTACRERVRKSIIRMQASLSCLEQCPKPVVAAIQGPCIGGGVDLACCADIRLAARRAFFSIRESRMAMVADLGTIQRLPHIIGQSWARELILTGRDFSAEDAFNMGFVTHVCEDGEKLQEESWKICRELAANSPLAVQGSKELLNFSREHGQKAGLDYIAQKNAVLLFADDVREAYRSFLEKRKPEFKGC